MAIEPHDEERHHHIWPEATGERKHPPPAPIRRTPEAPRDDQEAQRHRRDDEDQARRMDRIVDEDADPKESHALATMDNGIPKSAYSAAEDASPDEREQKDARTTQEKVGALDPAQGTETQGADGLLPGVIAGAGRTFDQIDDQEEHRSPDPEGEPPKQWPRNGCESEMKRRGVGLRRRF